MNSPFECDDLKRLIFTYLKQPKKHYLGNSPSYDAIKKYCIGVEREELHVLNPLLYALVNGDWLHNFACEKCGEGRVYEEDDYCPSCEWDACDTIEQADLVLAEKAEIEEDPEYDCCAYRFDEDSLFDTKLDSFCLLNFYSGAEEEYDPETGMTELHYYGNYRLNELVLTPT